jgi:hypothetical protein
MNLPSLSGHTRSETTARDKARIRSLPEEALRSRIDALE